MFIELLKMQKKADFYDRQGNTEKVKELDRRIDRLSKFIENIYKYDISSIKDRLLQSKNNYQKLVTASRYLEYMPDRGYLDVGGGKSLLNHAVDEVKAPRAIYNIRFDPNVPFNKSPEWQAIQERMSGKPVSNPELKDYESLTAEQAADIYRYFSDVENRVIQIGNKKRMRDLFPGMPFDLFSQLLQKAKAFANPSTEEVQVEDPVINQLHPEEAFNELYLRLSPFGAGKYAGGALLRKRLMQKLKGREFSNTGEKGKRKDLEDLIREGDFVNLFDYMANEFKAYSIENKQERSRTFNSMTQSDKNLLGSDIVAIGALKKDFKHFMDLAKTQDPFNSKLQRLILDNWDFSSYEVSPFKRQGLPEDRVAKWFPSPSDNLDLAKDISDAGYFQNMSVEAIAKNLSKMGMYFTKIRDRISRDIDSLEAGAEDNYIPNTKLRYNPDLGEVRMVFDSKASLIANKKRRIENARHMLELMEESGEVVQDDEKELMNYRVYEAIRNAFVMSGDTSMNQSIGDDGGAEVGDRNVQLSTGPAEIGVELSEEAKEKELQIQELMKIREEYAKQGIDENSLKEFDEEIEKHKAEFNKMVENSTSSRDRESPEVRRKLALLYIKKMEDREIYRDLIHPILNMREGEKKNAYLDWVADLVDDYQIRAEEMGINPINGDYINVDEEQLIRTNWMQWMQSKRTDGKEIVDIEVLKDPVYDNTGNYALDSEGKKMKGETVLIFDDGTKASVKSAPSRRDLNRRTQDFYDKDGLWRATMSKVQRQELRDKIEDPDLQSAEEYNETYEPNIERDVEYEVDEGDYIGEMTRKVNEIKDDFLRERRNILKKVCLDLGFVEWMKNRDLDTMPDATWTQIDRSKQPITDSAGKPKQISNVGYLRNDLMKDIEKLDPTLFSIMSTVPVMLETASGETAFGTGRARGLTAQQMLFYQNNILGMAPGVSVARTARKSGAPDYIKAYSRLLALFYNKYKQETDPESEPIDFVGMKVGYERQKDGSLKALSGGVATPAKKYNDLMSGVKNGEGKSDIDDAMYLIARAIAEGGYSKMLSSAILNLLGYSKKRMSALLLMDQKQIFDGIRIGALDHHHFKDIIGGFGGVNDSEMKSLGHVPDHAPKGKLNIYQQMQNKISDYEARETATIQSISGQPISEDDQMELQKLYNAKAQVLEELEALKNQYETNAIESRQKYFEDYNKAKKKIYSFYAQHKQNMMEDSGNAIRIVNESNAIDALKEYRDYLQYRYIDNARSFPGDTFGADKAGHFISILDEILTWPDEPEDAEINPIDVPMYTMKIAQYEELINNFAEKPIPNPFVEADDSLEEDEFEAEEEVLDEDQGEGEGDLEPEVQEEPQAELAPKIPSVVTPEQPVQPEAPSMPPQYVLNDQERNWLINQYTNPNIDKLMFPASVIRMLANKGFVEGQHFQAVPERPGSYRITSFPDHILRQLEQYASVIYRLEKLSSFKDREIDEILDRFGI